MISLVLKPPGVEYPSSAEISAQIDMLVAAAVRQGQVVEGIKMPYGYMSSLEEAGLLEHEKSFAIYKGMKIWVG